MLIILLLPHVKQFVLTGLFLGAMRRASRIAAKSLIQGALRFLVLWRAISFAAQQYRCYHKKRKHGKRTRKPH
jgi:hypothetical protein